MIFKDVAIGGKFSDRPAGQKQYMVYEKVSRSQAKCVKQIGYGNTRAIGGHYSFGSFKQVWEVENGKSVS